jgi:starch-binding outer membrane protein SusE/F
MKKILIFISFLIVAFYITSCESDIEKSILKSTIVANVITPLTASTFVLDLDHKADTFQTFRWTTVDFGIDMQKTYTIQVDKKKNKFKTPVDLFTVTKSLKGGLTIGELNKVLLGFVDPAVPDTIQFRVKTVINANVAPVYSNTTEALITVYATSFPPIYMTGAGVGDWNWNLYTYKELRSTAPNVYETIAKFTNGGAFRFFKQTDWGPTSWNYPYFTGTVSALFENAADGDLNFRFIGTTGYYRVTVNMATKSVAMVSVAEPVLFMTGAALGGWDWTTNYVQLTWKSNGIFQATTDFAVETFRFFAQQDWSPTSYNYPYFSAGTISNKFENANDGDKNFKFIGTPGSYTITVNFLDMIITMQ